VTGTIAKAAAANLSVSNSCRRASLDQSRQLRSDVAHRARAAAGITSLVGASIAAIAFLEVEVEQ
jgi:hypothetical protein